MSYTCSDYTNTPDYLRNFLFYMLTIKGRSELTVENYYLDLRLFLRFIKQHKKIVPANTPMDSIPIDDFPLSLLETVTTTDVYQFLNYTHKERGNSPRTRSRKTCALRMFFKYLTNNVKLLKENPVEYLELPSSAKTLPKHLTLEQCMEFLNSIDRNSATYERDFCMVTLFLNCGMRLSELTGLDLKSLAENSLTVVGKGNKERQIYLNDACLRALEDYKAVREENLKKVVDRDALFLNRNGRRLGQRRVQQIITELLKKAGFGDLELSTHKLRHTAATMMYQHGEVDIRVLQEILGHANLNTTQIYTHVANKQKEMAVQSNPLANFKKK